MFLGHGYIKGQVVWIPIPKNASTAHRNLFKANGWSHIQYADHLIEQEAYVVIRHPVQRWFSGVRQALKGGMVETVLEGGWPVFDQHTMRQTDYLLSTVPNRTYIRLEDAGRYVKDRWNLDLPVENRSTPPIDERVVPILEDFYRADLELYESIPEY